MTTLLCSIAPGFIFAAERLPVNLVYPSYRGDFYASANLSFAPGAVAAEDRLAVKTTDTQEEIPAKIAVRQHWPDGSIMNADVTFAANETRKRPYAIEYGDDVRAKKRFTEAAVLPVVAFSTAGAPRTSENMNLEVGQINVRVDKSPGIRYYWHLLPILLLVALTCYRARRTRQGLGIRG